MRERVNTILQQDDTTNSNNIELKHKRGEHRFKGEGKHERGGRNMGSLYFVFASSYSGC